MTEPLDKAESIDAPKMGGAGAHVHSASCSHGHNPGTASELVEPGTASSPSGHAKETVFSRIVGFMDIAGVFASTICMIHCLLMPIIVALLPVVAKPIMHHDWVHMGLAGFVLAFCLVAYVPGYLQHHDKRLIYIGCVGITLVFFATFVARAWGEIVEASIITAGNTIIIFGHFLNRRRLAHLKCKHRV